MKRIILSLALLTGAATMAQNTIETTDRLPNFNAEDVFRKQSFDRTVTCALDTVLYLTAKATGTSGLAINNATSASAMAQYFDAPQDITVSGVDFIAVKADATGGVSLDVDVEIYAAGADSLPTGTALAATTVAVDTNFYGGNLVLLTKSATFSTPATVSSAYCIVITNNSPNSINMYSNDYLAGDGGQEWLSSAVIGGNWLRSYQVSVGGNPYDADMFFHPYVTYDLTADFTITPNCQDGGMVTANHMSSTVAANRMYSFEAFLGTPENQYTWDWGDASPTENGTAPTHTYAAGTYNVTLTDSVAGWTTSCSEAITKSTCDQPATIGEKEIAIAVYPNPSNGLVTINSTEEIAQIQVLDLGGRTILSEQNAEINDTVVDLTNTPNGIYILNITLMNGTIINKRVEIVK